MVLILHNNRILSVSLLSSKHPSDHILADTCSKKYSEVVSLERDLRPFASNPGTDDDKKVSEGNFMLYIEHFLSS